MLIKLTLTANVNFAPILPGNKEVGLSIKRSGYCARPFKVLDLIKMWHLKLFAVLMICLLLVAQLEQDMYVGVWGW